PRSSRRFAGASAAASAAASTCTPWRASVLLMRVQFGNTSTPPASRNNVSIVVTLEAYRDIRTDTQVLPCVFCCAGVNRPKGTPMAWLAGGVVYSVAYLIVGWFLHGHA